MNTSRLFVVAVGISAYRNVRWRLAYARKDAEDIVTELQRLAGRQFREVVPTMLVDEQATREAIIEALVGLREACRPEDMAIVYLAGHGINVNLNDRRDRYHFLTVNVESEGKVLEANALPDHTLREHIDDIAGHRLLIIDTCNAGNARIDHKKGSYRIDEEGHRGPELDREENRPEALVAMFRELRPAPPVPAAAPPSAREGGAIAARAGVSVLAAAGPRHPAAESRHWGNGVFTMALLEGLRGRALRSGSAISVADLAHYTESRVMNETKNLQCPQLELGSDADRPLAQGPFDLSYPVGEQVGSYTVTQRLGEDDEATSYEATAEDRPGQRFVLRASHPSPPGAASEGDDCGERLLAAAELLRRCQHPGLPKILDSGHLKGQDGRCYVLVQPTIAQPQALTAGEAMAPARACQVLGQVAAALGALHAAGALYLGLCPRKVALAADGTAQLLDCTAIQEAEKPAPVLRRSDEVAVGSPLRYAAPERFAEAASASDRSDVYSLGVLAYEYLTGRYPYTIGRLEDLRDAQRRPLPPLPVSWGSLGPLVAAMLDPDPQQRPSAAAVAERLRAHAAQGAKGRLRQVFIVGAALGVVVVAATGLMLAGRGKPGHPNASPHDSATSAGAKLAVTPPQTPPQPPQPPPVPPAEILVPAGRLIQAKADPEGKDREVPVRSFYLDRTEVDNQSFAGWLRAVAGSHVNGNRVVDEDGAMLVNIQPPYSGLMAEGDVIKPREGYQHRPVVQVSFAAAQAFCKAQGKRLPWDMEWELAAAGSGAGRLFPWGGEPARCAGVAAARRKGQPCAGGAEEPSAVGAAAQDRTPEGIMDLGGNVSEWVDSRALPATAPLRPVRGGNWAKPATSWREYLTVAPSRVAVTLGFRCARDKKGDSQP